MIESKALVLTVERQVPGELVTNALAIEAFVKERIKDFTPEKYYDDPEMAKRDRAVLNAAAKDLNTRRLALEREFMTPFDPVKSAIKRATDMLNSGADKLGEVWGAVEETIKNEKRRDIEAVFSEKGFTLVELDRIFDQKWLNKTVKMKAVEGELDAKIKKIYDDIAVIEALPADVTEVKAAYLDTLDIGSALALANRLKANREKAAEEAASREQRKHDEHMAHQASELFIDATREVKDEESAGMAAVALDIDIDPRITFICEVKGTRAQVMALRQYMTAQGIEYRKVEGVA